MVNKIFGAFSHLGWTNLKGSFSLARKTRYAESSYYAERNSFCSKTMQRTALLAFVW